MFPGRVLGSVVAERKVSGLAGVKLLLVQPLDGKQQPVGPPLVAVDVVQAGPGDLVHLVGGREASMALGEPLPPVDAAVVGVIDRLHREAP